LGLVLNSFQKNDAEKCYQDVVCLFFASNKKKEVNTTRLSFLFLFGGGQKDNSSFDGGSFFKDKPFSALTKKDLNFTETSCPFFVYFRFLL